MSKDIGKNPILKSNGKSIDFTLKRLSDARFTPNEKMLAMIGIFILAISWFNFINFSIGNAQTRSKETGVRKVVGATRNQLVAQFVLECFMINVLALIIAGFLFSLARPLLWDFSANKVLPLFGDGTRVNSLFAIAFGIGAITSSAYPAMVMSSLKPVHSLKGKFAHGRYSLIVSIGLVVAQFAISIVAAIAVFIVSDQLDFFLRHDRRIKLEHIVAIKAPKILWREKANA